MGRSADRDLNCQSTIPIRPSSTALETTTRTSRSLTRTSAGRGRRSARPSARSTGKCVLMVFHRGARNRLLAYPATLSRFEDLFLGPCYVSRPRHRPWKPGCRDRGRSPQRHQAHPGGLQSGKLAQQGRFPTRRAAIAAHLQTTWSRCLGG